jgi:NADH:ubiquinone oxidoreductase subunit
MEENKRVVFSTDTKVWINRIIEILELHKKCYPGKYGNIDTNKTKSYVSKERIIVAYQEENWESAICIFPTEWLRLRDDEIAKIILREIKRD